MENQDTTISPFLPLAIALLGLSIWAGGQTIAAWHDHTNLTAARDGQNAAMTQSGRVRQQLTGLAGQTAQLSLAGDTDAQGIVDAFSKQGIKFSPPATGSNPTP